MRGVRRGDRTDRGVRGTCCPGAFPMTAPVGLSRSSAANPDLGLEPRSFASLSVVSNLDLCRGGEHVDERDLLAQAIHRQIWAVLH
jgi:hypothetical protein